jgi:hypothetical protein
MIQLVRVALKLRLALEDHVILIHLRVHGADLALAEGVIERVIDCGWRNA